MFTFSLGNEKKERRKKKIWKKKTWSFVPCKSLFVAFKPPSNWIGTVINIYKKINKISCTKWSSEYNREKLCVILAFGSVGWTQAQFLEFLFIRKQFIAHCYIVLEACNISISCLRFFFPFLFILFRSFSATMHIIAYWVVATREFLRLK